MILPCTSPLITRHLRKYESAETGRGQTVRTFWPVINKAGQYGQTRPVGETERPDQMRCVNIRACRRARP